MKKLPETILEVRGNHKVAMDRTNDIGKYVTQATDCLRRSMDKEETAIMRGALVRQADYYLDTIIRFANCAKTELRVAYLELSDSGTG